MTDRFPILRSLDPYHARIGYLGALASVSVRGLDRQDALAARFHDLAFERIYQDDPRFSPLLARIPPDRRAELDSRYMRPEEEDPTAVFTEPAPIEVEQPPADWLLGRTPRRPRPKLVRTEWLYISELWLLDADMPSPVGLLPREKIERIIDLARWTGVLLPTLELSEAGYLVQHLITASRKNAPDPALFNPISAHAHPALPLVYFQILLENELLYPFLVLEMVERWRAGKELATRGREGLLLAATDRLIGIIGEITDPEDALAVRNVDRFRESIAAKDSTQENYLRPRLEILVDLGLLGRRTGAASKFMWEPTAETEALATVLEQFTRTAKNVADALKQFLDRSYFAAMATVMKPQSTAISDDRERILWFARAFREIGREFGFTPGRTLAMKACLMAWMEGRTMEIGDVFDAIYRAAAESSPLSAYMHFSGGSRFDREFLIRIDDGLVQEVEAS